MRENNKRAIREALEDISNSRDDDVLLEMAIDWISSFWQATSAGYIRETPPHLTRITRRPKPEPVLIPGEQ